jgi:hypothetical protein
MTVAASRFSKGAPGSSSARWPVKRSSAGARAHGKVVEARTERVFKASELRRPAPCARAALRWLQRAALAP